MSVYRPDAEPLIRMRRATKKSLSTCWKAIRKCGLTGYLWKLEPGDSVGFPAGTGICHTFLNNTEQEVRLLVVGEANKKFNRIYYPLNPGYAATRQDRWVDHPPAVFWPSRREATENIAFIAG
ncbi:Hemolysin [Klebsiella michiganensis]|nr:Hemolysin [Klebsiella michiganensis]